MTSFATIARARQSPQLANTVALPDGALQNLLDSASGSLETWLKRHVIHTAFDQTYDGNDTNELQLIEPDLVTLNTISVRDGSGTVYTIPPSDFYAQNDEAYIWFIETTTNTGGFSYFFGGRRNVTINAMHGIAADAASLPAQIVQATVELCVRYWDSMSNSPTAVMERLGDYTIQRNTMAQMIEDLPKSVRGALSYFKNYVM